MGVAPFNTRLAAFGDRCRLLLSGRTASIIIITVVVVARVLHLLYFFNTRNDMSYQVLAAQNLYDGHGLSESSTSETDLSTVIYQTETKWPPGFSILFLPFYALFAEKYIPAALALGIFTALILLFAGRAVLSLVGVPLHLTNLYTLLTGFSIYYFYEKPCTDATGISFFTLALYFTLSILKNNKPNIYSVLGLIASLVICASVKYMYIPVVLVLPFYLFVKGAGEKNKYQRNAGLVTILSLAVIFGSLLLYQQATTGYAGYIKQPERGFFPANLYSLHPYLIASFIKPESINLLLGSSSTTGQLIFRGFQFLHIAGFVALVLVMVRKLRHIRKKELNLAGDYFFLFMLVAFSISSLLLCLSLTVQKEPLDDGGSWTYIEEPRYYGFLHVMLHIGAFLWFQHYRSKQALLKMVSWLVIIAMAIEASRGIIFTGKRVMNLKKEEYGWQQELRFQQYASSVIEAETLQNPNQKLVLTGSSDWMTLRAALYTRLPVFANVVDVNNPGSLRSVQPVTLIVIIRNNDLGGFGPYISSGKAEMIGNSSGFTFYKTYISSH